MFRYCIGMMGQGACYKFMGAYFVSFLVNCVMLDAGKASMIASIALYVEAIAGVLVGNISDTCTSKLGRRRPFILASGIVIPIVIFLITHTIHNTELVEIIYYLVLAILFRVFFSTFEIPYMAFGAEFASDYDDRTKLRTVTRVYGIIGNIVGYVFPLLILDKCEDIEKGWQLAGSLVSITVLIAFFSLFFFTKGRGVYLTKGQVVKKKNLFISIIKNYIELSKLKPMRLLILYKASFGSAMALFDVGMIFYLTNSLKLSNTNSAFIYALQIAIFLICTPFVNKFALKYGKAKQQMYFLIIGGILGAIIYFIAPSNTIFGIMYMVVFAIAQTSFWQVSSSIFYDCVEVDEWVNGKRREGDIMSMVSVLGTIVTAIMVQLFGIFLKHFGYDASLLVQEARTINFLNAEYILVPCILTIVAGLAVKLLPITRKRFESLQKALELRRENKDYSMYMDDVNKIVK